MMLGAVERGEIAWCWPARYELMIDAHGSDGIAVVDREEGSHAGPQAPYMPAYVGNQDDVYLPDDLKHALARIASSSGRSEADLIREALRDLVQRSGAPKPIGAIFSSGDPSLSDHVEEALDGFGER